MGDAVLLFVIIISCLQFGTYAYECDTGELRLVNGSSSNQGRVEFCRNGVWGTVSDYWFDINDAKVVCRKLGYNPDENGLNFSTNSFYGEGNGQVFLGYLNCAGTEDQILDCDYDNNWIGNDHSHDVGVTCPISCIHGALRLTGGFVSSEGTLEVCNNGAWSSICADKFQIQDGFVACRQMGLPATATKVITSYRFNNGHGSPTWTNFSCIGNESLLTSCPYNVGICQAYNTITATFSIVGLKCEGELTGNCSSGSIRLNGPSGANTVEGLIELCSNGAWGTVSNDFFGNKDALVACRQLGYPSPGVRVYPPSYFGDGSGAILLNDMQCLGSEQSLYACNRGVNTSHLESHSNDATIKCWKKTGDTCANWDVRFSNGSSTYGRVEVCQFQEWGSICDDSWDRNDARVICKTRNFNPSYASFYVNSAFGDGDKIPILFDNIGCNPNSNVFNNTDCNVDTQIESNCIFGHTVGVRCFSPVGDGCTNGEVRLQGGSNDNEGELQICRDGIWGYVCDNSMIHQNAQVFCRQMQKSTSWYSFSTGSLFGGSQDIAPLVYDRITCAGAENSLSSCSFFDFGTVDPLCTTVVGIKCEDVTPCSNWNIRTSRSNEGRIEICLNNVWTTVGDTEWDYNDARVACRQLGYYAPWSAAINNSLWGTGEGRVLYYNFQCDGTQTSLQSCTKSQYAISTPMENWYHSGRAGISCRMQNDAETCTNTGTVRLKDGSNSRQGRLEICMGGYWGSVCSDGWTQQNTLVACRQAGFETLRPIMTTSAYSGQGQGPVHLASVSCYGIESNLSSCASQSGIGVTNCYHGNDVGLICSESPADYYEMTITSSVDVDSVPVNSEVTLTCNSSPSPPNGVTYQWKTTILEDPISQSDVTSSVAKLTISQRHPKVSYYYCAMKLGNEVLGIGSIKLTLKNILAPTVPVVTASIGSSVTLTVQQTSTEGLNYLRNLQWYFDGIPIQNTLIPTYSISTDGLSLTISNLQELYSGEYHLQYNGLHLYQYSPNCEQHTIEFLREYPLFAPAVMKLQVGSITLPDNPQVSDSILIPKATSTSYKKYTPVIALTTYSIVPPSSLFFSLNWHEFSLSTFIYENAPKLYTSTGLLSANTAPHYDLYFLLPTVLQSGYYETQLTAEPDALLNSINCGAANGYGYADFFAKQLGFTSSIVLGSARQQILYYEKPSASLTSDLTVLTNDSDAMLNCSSVSGYPLYYNITLLKNNVSIANTIGSNPLVYNTRNDETGDKYGLYQCVVNNMFDTGSTTILLKEQATFSLLFNADCENDVWDNRNRSSFLIPILSLLQDACDCSLSGNSLTVDNVECTSELNVTLTFVYSSDTGLSSSDVFQNLYDLFDMGQNLSLTVSNKVLSINWPSNTLNLFTLPNEAVLALLFVGGFLAASIIFIIILIMVCICMRKRGKEKTTSNDRVGFNVNEEAVNVHQKPEEEDDEEWEIPEEKTHYVNI